MKTTEDHSKKDRHLFCIYPVSTAKCNELSSAQEIKNDILALRCLGTKITKDLWSCYQRSLNLELTVICLRYLHAHLTERNNPTFTVVRTKGQGDVYYCRFSDC